MTIIVEDGSGMSDSNSYASENDADDYFDARANDDWNNNSTGDKEGALIRATASLDSNYRVQYPGYRTLGRAQALEWPRTAAYDYEGIMVNTDEVPIEVIQATCELAVRELVSPGSTIIDIANANIIALRAGSVAITYDVHANANTVFQIVDAIMGRLIGTISTPFNASASRS